jgi:anti-sigma regulatory factor (Ser/Thr protein kinase)
MPLEATRTSDPAADPALLPRWMMLGSMTLPGRPEHVREARTLVARTLGDDPRADSALLLTSEVVTNAVVHSRSRLPGGTVAVVAAVSAAGLIITVTDNGSDSGVPAVRNSPGTDDHGNGLLLVESLADEWGFLRDDQSTTVWFRLSADGSPLGSPDCGLLPDPDRTRQKYAAVTRGRRTRSGSARAASCTA